MNGHDTEAVRSLFEEVLQARAGTLIGACLADASIRLILPAAKISKRECRKQWRSMPIVGLPLRSHEL